MLYPPRSEFNSFEPIATGTPFVESLGDYAGQIASSHAVLLGDLIRYKCPKTSNSDLPSCLYGNGSEAQELVTILETSTGRTGLSQLTLLPFSPLFGRHINSTNTPRAWCPECFEKLKKSGFQVYELLAWTLGVVTCCAVHNRSLVYVCPHCGADNLKHRISFCAGWCPNCGHWLGQVREHTREVSCSDYDLWVARAIGEIVSCTGTVDAHLAKENFKHALTRSAEVLAHGSRDALSAYYFGQPNYLSHLMLNGAAVQIDTFLTVVYTLGIPLNSILLGLDLTTFQPLPRAERKIATRLIVVRPQSELRNVLWDALRKGPAVSLTALAHSLGYTSGKYLRERAPDICEKLEKKFRNSENCISHAALGDIEEDLKRNLTKPQPDAIGTVAQRYGVEPDYLRKRLPVLCLKIRQKRRRTETKRVVRALKHAMNTVPPTPISQVAKSLGWNSTSRVWRFAPELTRLLSEVNEQYRQKSIQQWKVQIEACAKEYPPPSPTEIGLRMGLRVSTLRYHLPNLMKVISMRQIQYREKLRLLRAEQLFSKVAQIAQQISEEKLELTPYRVIARLGTRYAFRTIDVRRALSRVVSAGRVRADLSLGRAQETRKAA